MILKVPSLEKLVHQLSFLPGVGPKTAQRLAYYVLRSDSKYAEDLREALAELKEKVKECPACFSFTEEDICHFCTDLNRSQDTLCVVEDPSDILRIESSGVFKGRYHVLHGAISPLDGISPQDIKVQPLMSRIQEGIDGNGPAINEVILALDADLEGDTTVLYLAKLLREKDIKVTRIAHGVPIGGDIDYIDHRTLGRALENRIQV